MFGKIMRIAAVVFVCIVVVMALQRFYDRHISIFVASKRWDFYRRLIAGMLLREPPDKSRLLAK